MCKPASERESQDEHYVADTRRLLETLREEVVPINSAKTNGTYRYTTKTSLDARKVFATEEFFSAEPEETVICDSVDVYQVS